MRSRVRRYFLLVASGGLLVFGSCDQKVVGELPEIQKEHVLPVAANQREPAGAPSGTPSAKPTPADFFPDSGR